MVLVGWEGPDDSTAWKEALARAVAAQMERVRDEPPGWEAAHPLDPEWLSANGLTYWEERSALTGGSSYVKRLHYATIALRPAERALP
jgi:hypothetical protein